MNEELLHLIGKLLHNLNIDYANDEYVIEQMKYMNYSYDDRFTDDEFDVLVKAKKEYEFCHKMTYEQTVITYAENIGNPCSEILLK